MRALTGLPIYSLVPILEPHRAQSTCSRQKAAFLSLYGGLVLLQNVIRPLRFAISAALSPGFDKLILTIQNKTGLNKAKSMAIVVFTVNVLGTFTMLFTGVALASLLSGVAIFPPKLA